jgi:hypothetical protein
MSWHALAYEDLKITQMINTILMSSPYTNRSINEKQLDSKQNFVRNHPTISWCRTVDTYGNHHQKSDDSCAPKTQHFSYPRRSPAISDHCGRRRHADPRPLPLFFRLHDHGLLLPSPDIDPVPPPPPYSLPSLRHLGRRHSRRARHQS